MSTATSKTLQASPIAGQPANTFILITNADPGVTWISMPNAGTIWVANEYQINLATVYIWHQGGATTPVPPGFNEYVIGAGDALVYQLQDSTDSIKLGWAYV